MNDYELLYLIQCENEIAYNIMMNKYKPLIYSKMKQLNVTEKDDFLQEGLIILDRAINIYSDKYNKTFTKFFEFLLNNRFLDLIKARREIREVEFCEDMYYKEDYELDEETYNYNIERFKNMLPENLHIIFDYYFVSNYSANFIANKIKEDVSDVYYKIQKIRRILKKSVLK